MLQFICSSVYKKYLKLAFSAINLRNSIQMRFWIGTSPWENGYIESFNGKLRDELLNGEIFDTILEAKVLTEMWRKHYNKIRPHSSLNFSPPVPEVTVPC